MKTMIWAAALVIFFIALKSSMTYAGETVDAKELKKIISAPDFKRAEAAVLDVREYDEFAEGRIEGAVHIPLGELQGRMGELKNFKKLYVICYSGARSSSACRIISKLSPETSVVNVSGGMSGWYGAGFEVKK